MRTTATVTGTVKARCTRLNTERVFRGDTRMGTAARTSVEQAPDWDPAPAADPGDHMAQHSELVAAPPSQLHVILQVLLIVVAVTLGLWALYELAAVVFVLILAALLAYVVEPLVHLAECETRITG